uniref:SR-CI n=1 Tax=Drosophila simulans TaxID=7240 RepID=Q5ELP3_DROSI|nr:SR-CI [Drosophila simulans]
MEFFWTLAVIVLYCIGHIHGRCERSIDLDHGIINYRPRNLVRFRCNRGYTLQGSVMQTCDRDGRLRGEKPFCANRGCERPEDPENGHVENLFLRADVVCHDGYVLVGGRTAYCDGERWNTQLGSCRRSNHTRDHSCDFESEDQCGWEAETTFRRPWKRVSPVSDIHSLRTGPRHDHTFKNESGGHYMRMETQLGAYGSYHLISPIYPRALTLKTACCFRFHYFMFGAGVDSLVVSVKPVSMPMATMWNRFRANCSKFEISGQQGSQWLEHTITIDEMQEDFQVIFTATDARSQFGDIAIDDVKLMTGSECGTNGFTTTTEPPAPTGSSEPPLVYDMMSCSGRCGTSISASRATINGIVMGCGCNDECLLDETCCLNYLEECTKELLTTTEDDISSMPPTVTSTTTSTTKKPTTTTTSTTSTSTTTTKRPTTTTTTTKATTTKRTTTTKKPTTTSTTPKPTTTTSTTAKSTTSTTLTTPTTTTTRNVFTTRKTTTIVPTSSTEKTTGINTTKKTRNRITWKVDPQDIEGHTDTGESTPNPALVVLYLLIGVVLVIVLANVVNRWIIPITGSRTSSEKAVRFKKAFESLKKHRRRNSMDQPLCDSDNEDGDYFEEMGVDIRHRTDL